MHEYLFKTEMWTLTLKRCDFYCVLQVEIGGYIFGIFWGFFVRPFLFPHQAPESKVSQPEVKEEAAPPAPVPAKEEPAAVSAPPEPEPSSSSPSPPNERDTTADLKKHEPHLGPRPRSHNRVLNPPGGKSSVVFYWWAEHATPPCLCPYTPCLLSC